MTTKCDTCKATHTEEFGCECDPLIKRTKALIEMAKDLKQQSIAEQNFKVAEQVRDAIDKLIIAIYVLREGDSCPNGPC